VNSITVNSYKEIPKGYTGHFKFTNGTQAWYKNSKLHREDGPAVIYPDGTQWWYKNSLKHREDGPAVIYPDGEQFWYLNNMIYSKRDFYKELYKRGIITEQELFIELL